MASASAKVVILADYSESMVLESLAKSSFDCHLAAKAWFGRRFKNHRLPTKVVDTLSNQDGKL